MRWQRVIGIDVSMQTLDFSLYDGKEHRTRHIPYTKESVIQALVLPFAKRKEELVFVMESTGVYHTKLACWLFEEGMQVAVVNPLQIRRYAEMRLMRVKSDASDARLIAEYGWDARSLPLFQPPEPLRQELELLLKESEALNQEKVRTRNRLHALRKRAGVSPKILELLQNHLAALQETIETIQRMMRDIIQKHFSQEYQLLQSIPGIGLKTGSAILSMLRGFETFQSAKQVCAYIGIAPSPYDSGSSIHKRGSISKRGNPLLRKLFYMAAMSAIQYNPLIRKKYERLLRNGKNEMQALIAAANKLLRIAFGVLKRRRPFDENYLSSARLRCNVT